MRAPSTIRPTSAGIAAFAPALLATACGLAPVEGLSGATPELVERRLAAMGTGFDLAIEAPTRAEALSASEAAVSALESVERRLSTWREDSELAALNRSAVGRTRELSPELARELATALDWARATQGAFDPAVGGLVRAWDLRGPGRIPTEDERRGAIVPGGIAAALALDATRAVRLDERLCLEEGGFGKGAGLDAALLALESTTAVRATLDLGGQVAWFRRSPPAGAGATEPLEIADPRDRARAIAALRTARVSAATSGNSEHARVVDGRRIGHLLDPRTGESAPDFGSVTVLADRALDADCLSTGLFVLGPERALQFAASHPEIDVVVVEVRGDGGLRLRASAGVAPAIEILDPAVALAAPTPTEPRRSTRGR